jgi:hypothetical protein
LTRSVTFPFILTYNDVGTPNEKCRFSGHKLVSAMNDTQFQDHLDRFGDDFRVWPAAVRTDAEIFLASSGSAQLRIAEARQIREALTSPDAIRAPTSLKESIFAIAFGQQDARPRARRKSDQCAPASQI